MNKEKPEWAKGERLWEGFTDINNPSKLDDAYFELFGEVYVADSIDHWRDSDSEYFLLSKGRVEGFEKVDDGYKYFYSLDPTNKNNQTVNRSKTVKKFTKGFIDGYSDNEFDISSSDSDKTYYLDFHEGKKKRQVHELILNLCGNFGIENFEENQKMALDVISEW